MITDAQLDYLDTIACKLGTEDRAAGRRIASDTLCRALDVLEASGERTEDEFAAVITPDDLPDSADRNGVVEAYLIGYSRTP